MNGVAFWIGTQLHQGRVRINPRSGNEPCDFEIPDHHVIADGSKPEPSLLVWLVVSEIKDDFPIPDVLRSIPDRHDLDTVRLVGCDHELWTAQVMLGQKRPLSKPVVAAESGLGVPVASVAHVVEAEES